MRILLLSTLLYVLGICNLQQYNHEYHNLHVNNCLRNTWHMATIIFKPTWMTKPTGKVYRQPQRRHTPTLFIRKKTKHKLHLTTYNLVSGHLQNDMTSYLHVPGVYSSWALCPLHISKWRERQRKEPPALTVGAAATTMVEGRFAFLFSKWLSGFLHILLLSFINSFRSNLTNIRNSLSLPPTPTINILWCLL